MNISQIVTSRRTAKAFDASRRLPENLVAEIKTLLRYAPSSVNSQPWHFIIAGSDEAKGRIADTLKTGFAYNEGKVRAASHVVVFCARNSIDETHTRQLLEQEDTDGRFATPEAKAGQNNTRSFYVKLHGETLNDMPAWVDRQIYLALGTLLLGAAALGIDACPMEGLDTAALDQALGLKEKGLRSVVMVALGYSGADDFNAKLPKSRLPATQVISEI